MSKEAFLHDTPSPLTRGPQDEVSESPTIKQPEMTDAPLDHCPLGQDETLHRAFLFYCAEATFPSISSVLHLNVIIKPHCVELSESAAFFQQNII